MIRRSCCQVVGLRASGARPGRSPCARLARVATLGLVLGALWGQAWSVAPDVPTRAAFEKRLARLDSLNLAWRYEEAEQEGRALVSKLERAGVPDSATYARVLDRLVPALLGLDESGSAEALELAERALALKERHLPPGDVELAVSLRTLASVWGARGELWRALDLGKRAVGICEQAGPEHACELARALERLGRDTGPTLSSSHPAYFERALAILEQVLPPDDPELASSLESAAFSLSMPGAGVELDRRRARELAQRALAIRERAFGPDHPSLARSFLRLADATSELEDALEHYRRALSIAENWRRGEHQLTATILNNMAPVLESMGDIAGARSVQARALSVEEKIHGPSSPRIVTGLQNLSYYHWTFEDYAPAKQCLERAVAICEEKLPGARLSQSLGIYADLLVAAGDYPQAVRLAERAMEVARNSLEQTDQIFGGALVTLGHAYARVGRLAEADSLQARGIAIVERVDPEHFWLPWLLTEYAALLRDRGEFEHSRQTYEKALKVGRAQLAEGSPLVAATLGGLASVLAQTGAPDSAQELYQQALAIRRKAFGDSHSEVAQNLIDLAGLSGERGRFGDALAYGLEAAAIERDCARLVARSLPERQALHYAVTHSRGLGLALSALPRVGETAAADSTWDELIRSRALVLDEIGSRNRGVLRIVRKAEEYKEKQQHLANAIIRKPSEGLDPAAHRRFLDRTRREVEQAEQELAEASTGFRRELARGRIGLREVREALPAGVALVAYVECEPARWSQTASSRSSPATRPGQGEPPLTRVYAAFVFAGATPSLVPLGPAARIDSLVARWSEAVAASRSPGKAPSESRYRSVGRELRRAIWDPVAARIGAAQEVFVVPDGALNLVSLAVLPDERGGYLIESGPQIHHLSAERDLVPPEPGSSAATNLLVVGGADYDAASSAGGGAALHEGEVLQYRGPHAMCAGFHSLHFERLPGARAEVEELAAQWVSVTRGGATGQVQELAGDLASEANFKRLAPRHRVVHVATHGFFLGVGCPSVHEQLRGIGGLGGRAFPAAPPSLGEGEDPLLLSGLALAGANRRDQASPGEEDGILTAQEIAALDLSGVEWAVLSACETGVGEVRAGEGVFGLRRAFQVAGARTLIMSLWAVEDEATRRWMGRLYEGKWVKGLSTAEAVRTASLEELAERRAKGQSTHPFYWGAFVAAGDWR